MKAKIAIKLSPSVIDLESKELERLLKNTGETQIKSIIVAKYVEIEYASESYESVKNKVDSLKYSLLSNNEEMEIISIGDE